EGVVRGQPPAGSDAWDDVEQLAIPLDLGAHGGVLELEHGAAARAGGQAELDLVDRAVGVDPGHREQAWRLAAQDLAAGVALEAEPPADAEVAGDREEPAVDPVRVGAGLPDVLDRRVVAAPQHGGACLAGGDAPAADLTVELGERVGAVGHGSSPAFSVEVPAGGGSASCVPRRVRFPLDSSVARASRCGVQKRRKPSSQRSTSPRGSGSTAYRRRVPSALTVANPLSLSTR